MSFQGIRAAILVVLFSSIAQGEVPAIDGVFSDWGDQHVVANDDQGDASASFDITQVSAVTNGTELYLHFDVGTEINLQNGDESDGTLKLVLDLPHGRRLTIDFRGKTATLSTDPNETISWPRLDFVCLPTYASDRYELRLNLEKLHIQPCDTVQLNFAGSDELERSVSIVLEKCQAKRAEITLARSNADDIRIANLNTLHQGLGDAGRSESIKRLLAAAQADIYCFQEEWDEVKFRKVAPRVVPSEERVNLHWVNGCGVATSLPLEPIPMELAPGAAVAVTLPESRYLVVVSIHLKCCGFAGSREDRRRIQQTRQLVNEIRKLRNGKFGDHLREAGIVIVGDYNLVGSRKPLDVLKTAGMADWILPGLGDDAALTWRRIRDEDAFWPGRLDIVTYDQARLVPSKGCIVNTSRMAAQTLDELKLYAHDSWASDHLLVIADFQLVR